MSLTLVVLTMGGPRLNRLLAWAQSKEYIDKVNVYFDLRGRPKESTLPFSKVNNVENVEVKNIDHALSYCHSPEKVDTEWALHLGDDELMGQWMDEDAERLMRAPYDVYSFPRYNLIEGLAGIDVEKPSYISSLPWYPDWCQRLFRPGSIIHNGEVHEGPQVDGRLAMARPHVFHFDFIEQSLKEREAKWKRYLKQGVVEASRRRGLPEDYYKRFALPEEFEYEISVCQEAL